MFWMGLPYAMRMCRWGEVIPPFPVSSSLLSSWRCTTCFISINLLSLPKFPVSPGLSSFCIALAQWWFPKENFKGVETAMRVFRYTGHKWGSFLFVWVLPADCLLLSGVEPPHPPTTVRHHLQEALWKFSSTVPLPEDQGNSFPLQCSLKWADGFEVRNCERAISFSYVVPVYTSRFLSQLTLTFTLVKQFLSLLA